MNNPKQRQSDKNQSPVEAKPKHPGLIDSLRRGRMTWAILLLAGIVSAVAIFYAFNPPENPTSKEPQEPLHADLAAKVLEQATTEMRLGQMDKALELMEAFVKQTPDDVAVRPLLAEDLMQLSRPADAEREIDEVLKRTPNRAYVLWLKAELVALRGGKNYMSFYDKAVAAPDATPETYLRYGLRMLTLGEDDAGEKYLRKAFDEGMKDFRTYNALGRLEYKRNHFAQALPLLTEALKRRVDDGRIWGLIASCQKNMGQIDAALHTLEEGLKSARGGERSGLLMELGDAQLQKQNIGAAAETFTQAGAYPDVAAPAAFRAAQCYYLMDKFSKALEQIDKAAQLAPTPDVLKWKKKIEDEHFVGAPGPTTAPAFQLK